MLGIFTNNFALAFKYDECKQYLQVKDNQYIAIFCKSFALSFNVLHYHKPQLFQHKYFVELFTWQLHII